MCSAARRSRNRSFVAFNRGLAILIVLNVTGFVVESFPSMQDPHSPYAPWFYGLEAVSSCVFILEYFARLWTIPESHFYRTKFQSAWRARCSYALSIRALVDLVSCAPFFVELLVPGQLRHPPTRIKCLGLTSSWWSQGMISQRSRGSAHFGFSAY